MKLNILLVFSVLVSLGLFWHVTRRKKETAREYKRNRFQSIKLRVTGDVLREFEDEVSKVHPRIEKVKNDIKARESEITGVAVKESEKKSEVDACENDKKPLTDALAAVESEVRRSNEEFTKQKTSWEAEVASLNKQKDQRSKVCDFIKTDSEMGRKMCGTEAPKPEEAKAEAPKPEEAKVEAPKPEEAKAEAPKPEEAKAEAPKPEEAKAEPPKPEEPKAEAPKPEEAKAEAPKPEEAKAEAPKPEEAKAEDPK